MLEYHPMYRTAERTAYRSRGAVEPIPTFPASALHVLCFGSYDSHETRCPAEERSDDKHTK